MPQIEHHLRLLLAALVLLAATGTSLHAQPFVENASAVPGEVLVQFDTNASDVHLADAIRRGGFTVKKHLPFAGKSREESGLVVLRTPLPVSQALAVLQGHPAVRYAEANLIRRHQSTANDPNYLSGKLWGMYGDLTTPANPYGSQAGEAWAAGNVGSTEVYVAVLDQGIDINHPDLKPNIGRNPGEIPGNGVDDDGNGYVDDVYGWDFVSNDNTVYDNAKKDAHGTHVAGTIGGAGGNGLGIAGMCWNVRLMSGKFLGPNGGSIADEVEAIEYFIDLKQRHGLNLVAINASYGAMISSLTEQIAILRAAKAGILVVAAAGNSGDWSANFPAYYNTTVHALNPNGSIAETGAAYDAVISVAAIDSKGALATWSTRHPTKVDLAAPGAGILSTLPGGKYGLMEGTSMATPHVTGACALYLSAFPGAAPWEIKDAILTTAIPTPSLTGNTLTGGRLNVSGFHMP
jgi:subtilisin family serine protease